MLYTHYNDRSKYWNSSLLSIDTSMTLTTHNDDHGQTHRLYTHYNDRTLEVFSGYNYGTT